MIGEGSALSIVSAYFTIYAFDALRGQLAAIDSLRFLFGEPRFTRSLDPERTDAKRFGIEDDGLQLQNRLQQKRIARECASWIADKVQIRSVRQSNLLHGKMYCIAKGATGTGLPYLWEQLMVPPNQANNRVGRRRTLGFAQQEAR